MGAPHARQRVSFATITSNRSTRIQIHTRADTFSATLMICTPRKSRPYARNSWENSHRALVLSGTIKARDDPLICAFPFIVSVLSLRRDPIFRRECPAALLRRKGRGDEARYDWQGKCFYRRGMRYWWKARGVELDAQCFDGRLAIHVCTSGRKIDTGRARMMD